MIFINSSCIQEVAALFISSYIFLLLNQPQEGPVSATRSGRLRFFSSAYTKLNAAQVSMPPASGRHANSSNAPWFQPIMLYKQHVQGRASAGHCEELVLTPPPCPTKLLSLQAEWLWPLRWLLHSGNFRLWPNPFYDSVFSPDRRTFLKRGWGPLCHWAIWSS